MTEITINTTNGQLTVSSVQVASDFEKNHKHVLDTIRNLTAENSAVKNLFIDSSYINERGREYKCYELTRDGFSLLVMGFTGKKALEWKLKYIAAFNAMEQRITAQVDMIRQLEAEAKMNRAIAMRINAENRRMKLLLNHPEVGKLSAPALETLALKTFEQATGQDVSQVLPEVEETFSATEVGKMIGGISANKIGKTANAHGLKTPEYGIFVMDKSRYSSKQMPSFRYNWKGVEKLAEILGVEVKANAVITVTRGGELYGCCSE